MSLYDEYCLICGGPPGDIDLDDLAQQVLTGQCSSPLGTADPRAVAQALATVKANLGWVKHWVGITSDERRWDLGEYTGDGCFRLPDSEQQFLPEGPWRSSHIRMNKWREKRGQPPRELPPYDGPSGIVFHRSCEQVLQADLDYQPSHRALIHRLRDGFNRDGNLVEGLDYGPIVGCFEQYFDYVKAIVDGIDWMLRDPLVHRRSRERIVEMWRNFPRLLM